VGPGLDKAVETEATEGARTVRSLDDRLTLVAVRMTYVALSIFFACFYFALFYLQLINQNGMWLPPGVTHPSTALGVAEVAFVVGASLIYFWGQRVGLYRRNFGKLHTALWVAGFLAVAALATHVAELHSPGFSLQGGGYVSVFIALEAVFTVVLAVATLVLFGLANRARLGLFRRSGIAIEAFGEFLGWLSAIALIDFLALYVQPFLPSAG
jgi:hypothetical protein